MVLAIAFLALSASPATAATVVASPAAPDGTAGSLRQLVAGAGVNDTIQLPPGTYRLTQGHLSITKDLTVEGLGRQAGNVLITAEGRSRVLLVNPPAANIVDLRRLQVAGGRVTGGTGAGILKQGAGSLDLEEVTLAGNSVSGSQGGGGLVLGGQRVHRAERGGRQQRHGRDGEQRGRRDPAHRGHARSGERDARRQ